MVGLKHANAANQSAGKLSYEKPQSTQHLPPNAFPGAPLNGGASALGRRFRAESVQQLCESDAAPSFDRDFVAIALVLSPIICVKRAALVVNLFSRLWLPRVLSQLTARVLESGRIARYTFTRRRLFPRRFDGDVTFSYRPVRCSRHANARIFALRLGCGVLIVLECAATRCAVKSAEYNAVACIWCDACAPTDARRHWLQSASSQLPRRKRR